MTSAPTRAVSVVQYRMSASGVADAQLSPDARVLGCLRLPSLPSEIPADLPPCRRGVAPAASGWRAVRRRGAFMIG